MVGRDSFQRNFGDEISPDQHERVLISRPGDLFPLRKEGRVSLPGEERNTVSIVIDVEVNLPLDDSFFAPETGGTDPVSC